MSYRFKHGQKHGRWSLCVYVNEVCLGDLAAETDEERMVLRILANALTHRDFSKETPGPDLGHLIDVAGMHIECSVYEGHEFQHYLSELERARDDFLALLPADMWKAKLMATQSLSGLDAMAQALES